MGAKTSSLNNVSQATVYTCSNAMDKLDDSVRNLFDAVDRLQAKLNPLLVESEFPPSEPVDGVGRSALSQSLLSKAYGVDELTNRINFLFDNIDF